MARIRTVNSGSFAKTPTVMLTKNILALENAIGENTVVNVSKVVRDKLEESYRSNLISTYGPRSSQGAKAAENYKIKKSTYTNTHTLENASHAVIEDAQTKKGIRKYAKIVIDDDVIYREKQSEKNPEPVTALTMYEWLTKGTHPPKDSTYMTKNGSELEFHHNYPTPVHPFNIMTITEMKGFLASLESDIRNGKYTTYKYTGKKTPRKYYKGMSVQ